tara:strand:+ start:1532 stop:2422 length:891 start_codon:yes stop_codon:yes gene_type:complete
MRHGSLFSGIGGFDLAAEWSGWENVFHCEWNEFGQKVLKHYWPKAISYGDITKTDFNIHRGRIDVLSGGFPCQPYSQAGKRLGKEDDRHLWPEMLRAIREIQPSWVVGENVFGLINWNEGVVFDEVQADLEAEGYEVQPYVLPACSVNAPHRRDRVWFVAHSHKCNDRRTPRQNESQSKKERLSERNEVRESAESGEVFGNVANTKRGSKQRERKCRQGKAEFRRRSCTDNKTTWENFPTQPPICGRNDGISSKLDGITFPKWRNESIKAYGNAIVPQVALQIFKSINEYETLQTL